MVSTPNKQSFARYAHAVASSPYGATVVQEQDSSIYAEDEDSLAHLSAQLQAHGYLNRSLDLLSLFSLPPPPIATHVEQTDKQLRHALRHASAARAAEDKAREQIVRCLWTMLGARVEATSALESLSTELRVLAYDYERMKTMLAKERGRRAVAEKDTMAEQAKAKAANDALIKETARHRQTKEDLVKARSALQFVKTQTLHDQKRREAEMTTTLVRLQRLSSDPVQTKFVVLNPVLRGGRVPTVAAATRANAGELALLEEALGECDSARRRVEGENAELRELIGEVEEWSMEMVKLRGVGSVEVAVVEAVEGATPHHLTDSVKSIAPVIHQKLHEIRTSIVTLIESTDEEIKRAQEDVEEALEHERLGRAEEKLGRTNAERELAEAAVQIAATEKLVADFTQARLVPPALAVSNEHLMDSDQTPAPRAALMSMAALDSGDEAAKKALAEERRKFTEAAIRLSQEKAELEMERLTIFEAQRALDVASFLKDMDSPPPILSKLSSLKSSVSAQSSALPPSTRGPAPRSAKKNRAPKLETVSERSPLSSTSRLNVQPAPIKTSLTDVPPSPFLSSAPEPILEVVVPKVRKSSSPRRPSALKSLLAMADSPLAPTTKTSKTSYPIKNSAAIVPSKKMSMAERSRAEAEAGAKENEALESIEVRTTTKKIVTANVKSTETDRGDSSAIGRVRVKESVPFGRSDVF